MSLIKKLIIDESLSLKDAMLVLDSTAKGIVFVVNKDRLFLGTLTDGDIRRWILKGGALDANAKDVAFKNAFSLVEHQDKTDVIHRMSELEIEYAPILNQKGQIVDVLANEHRIPEFKNEQVFRELDVDVVIMAGGKGTRLDPFTKVLPKPLIPIGDKTVLEIIIERFTHHNLHHIYLSVNYKAAIIKAYFEDIDRDYKITYIEESIPLGTAGALHYLRSKTIKPIIVTNCDIIVDADYADLVYHHTHKQNDITIVVSLKHYNIPYGVCEIENGGDLKHILEKPEYSMLINTGMYVVSPRVLKMIPKDSFFHFTHLIEKVKMHGGKVGVFPIGENAWTDTGEWNEYKSAVGKFEND